MGVCYGEIAPCQVYYIDLCHKRKGCFWDSDYTCMGTPTPCENMDKKLTCLSLDTDCSWSDQGQMAPELVLAMFTGISLAITSLTFLFCCVIRNKFDKKCYY